MKKLFTLLSIVFLAACSSEKPFETKTIKSGKYTYQTVVGDPMKARIYELENGLKVYLSDYKNEPRLHAYIAVAAGGKNDPAENTGLAHYLEHMMFKGTEDFGTMDFDTEKIYLDSIETMFNTYATLTDPEERKAFYAQIDAVSNEAAKYAIPNEFDKMIAAIGGKSLNAYTSKDETVYTVDIPANEIGRFLELEGNRFKTITNRLFHTELEAVYEEKNQSLDSDGSKMYHTVLQSLFRNHTYGTQLIIGTIEHLKNPSVTAIKEFFDTYYRPNNVAICISGDLDYDKTIAMIDEYFGTWEANENLPEFKYETEDPITEPIVKEVVGPSAERLYLSYRFAGEGTQDQLLVSMTDMILSNSTAGLIDLNLNQQQQVLNAGCSPWKMNDYTVHTFYGTPKQNQTLEEVKDLILAQIEKVKKGEFEDWLMPAVIADFKKSKMKELEANSSRAGQMLNAFTTKRDWSDYLQDIERMENITKEQIMAFAQENYNDNYVVVYKRLGEDPNKQKVEKPLITKVPLNKDEKSDFQEALLSKPVEKLKPVFINFEEDLNKFQVSGLDVISKKNNENELFQLVYLLDIGSNEDPKLENAVQYLEYIGTGDLSAEDFKKELYKLGCDFSVGTSNERTYVTLSGLDEKMEAATALFESLLAAPSADQVALEKLIDRKLQSRTNAKKNKDQILWNGLYNYSKYGPSNPFTNVLSNAELTQLEATDLVEIIKTIPKMPHKILYYGPRKPENLKTFLESYHKVSDEVIPLPERVVFEPTSNENRKVYWTDYDMVQSEIILSTTGAAYRPEITPSVALFNEYFGGGMNSVVFQEIREAQGLAYSAASGYAQASSKEKSDVLWAYLGVQADKQPEAMAAMYALLDELPKSEIGFEVSKDAILNQLESERITRADVIWSYLDAEKKGVDYDLRKDIYNRVKEMTFDDLKAFHAEHIKGQPLNTALVGNKDLINFKNLEQYGEVHELSLDEIFGYGDTETIDMR